MLKIPTDLHNSLDMYICQATETGGMPPVIRSTKNMPHQRRTAALDLINNSFLLTGKVDGGARAVNSFERD